MAKQKAVKSKKSTADIIINIVIAVVIIAVLALAVVAVGDKFKPDIYTVQEAAEAQGMTVENFVAEYGLEGAKADDNMDDYYNSITCGNYAKLMGMTFEDFAAQAQLPENITENTTMGELEAIMAELSAAMENAQQAEATEDVQAEPVPEEAVPAE